MTVNEILFYGGLVLGIAFFIAAVAIFFVLKVPSSIAFLLKMNRRGFAMPRQKGTSQLTETTMQQGTTSTVRKTSSHTSMTMDGPTEVLGEQATTRTQNRLTAKDIRQTENKKAKTKTNITSSMVDGPTEILDTPTNSIPSKRTKATTTINTVEEYDEQTGVLIEEVVVKEKEKKATNAKRKKATKQSAQENSDSPTEILM